VLAFAWSPDSSRISSASADTTLRVWDVDTGREVATLEGHSLMLFGCAWSPDGTQVASASEDETVCVWDVNTREEVARLEAGAYTRPRFGSM
jgi:WD40 repeat protein